MRIPALFPVLALCAVLPAAALETDRQYGEASFKFLKLPLAPRVVSLAGAGAALANDAGALDLNPAAGASDSGHLVLGKGYPFSEFQGNSSHITWSIPLASGYRVLLNARYLGFDDIEGWGERDDSTSAYGAHSMKLQAGLAGSFGKVMWGATVNYAGNGIASANYTTGMINLGLRYELLPGLMAGASAVNADFYDSKAMVAGNPDPFPPTAVQAGLAYTRGFGADWQVSLAADARARNDEDLAWPMGLEVGWRQMLFARAGFPVGEQEPGLAAGLGLRWSLFQFSYAFQSHATLGPGHFWSLDLAI